MRAGQDYWDVSQMFNRRWCGVSNGARTRDILDHNQVLYQLSYTHHVTTLHALTGISA